METNFTDFFYEAGSGKAWPWQHFAVIEMKQNNQSFINFV